MTPAGLIASGAERWDTVFDGQRVRFGPDALEHVGEEARDLGGRRAFLATDPGIVAAGHVARAEAALRGAGLEVVVWDGVRENPSSSCIAEAAEAARGFGPDLLVGLGGGSSMDVAKGVNFLLSGGGRMEDYHGRDRGRGPMVASMGVPTTAGTGSEAQSYALVSRDADKVKMACGDRRARFRTVILDPTLTASMPRDVAALSAMDAASHAVESHVTRNGTPMSRALAAEAWRTLDPVFEAALAPGATVADRGRMLVGAYLAGCAIEQSMLGAAHACANPLTARHGAVHGAAVAVMLPAVVRFNGADDPERYRGLVDAADPAAAVALRIEAMRASAGLPDRVRSFGVSREALPELARDAAAQWTARHNPREVGESELLALYEEAW